MIDGKTVIKSSSTLGLLEIVASLATATAMSTREGRGSAGPAGRRCGSHP
jgi:hypothetical protein